MYDPAKDGIDHINIYSKGRTALGKALTNFAAIGIDHPKYGKFASLEALWYWLSTGKIHDELRPLVGFAAKQKGRMLPKVNCPGFEDEIRGAMRLKIEQYPTPRLREALKKSALPFTHYYVFGGKVVDAGYSWIVEEWEKVRNELKGE